MKPADLRGLYEEISNSVTHAIALGLSLAGASVLIVRSLSSQNTIIIASAITYAIGLNLLFISSTLYHGFQLQPFKHYFRIFDHSTIYIMIASSMTPFILPFAQDNSELLPLGLVWVLAILGVLYKIFLFGRSELESVSSYFIVTTVGFFGAVPLFDRLHFFGSLWLMFGLLVYAAGVYFYVRDDHPFYHTIWHCFVMGGAGAHYVAIYLYALPSAVG
jgi:hemolysin III